MTNSSNYNEENWNDFSSKFSVGSTGKFCQKKSKNVLTNLEFHSIFVL